MISIDDTVHCKDLFVYYDVCDEDIPLTVRGNRTGDRLYDVAKVCYEGYGSRAVPVRYCVLQACQRSTVRPVVPANKKALGATMFDCSNVLVDCTHLKSCAPQLRTRKVVGIVTILRSHKQPHAACYFAAIKTGTEQALS